MVLQIKTWLASGEIKDKSTLMENRKLEADLDKLVTKVLQVPLALILLAVPST